MNPDRRPAPPSRDPERRLLPPKIAAGFAAAIVTVIAGGLVSTQTLAVRRHNVAQVNHTFATLTTLNHLLLAVRDGETGQRGYLLTGNEAYLDRYRKAQQEAEKALAALGPLTAGDPRHTPRVAALAPLVGEKFAEMGRTIQLRRAGDAGEALGIVRSDEGLRLMWEIRDRVEAMVAEERGLLEERQSNWTRGVFASNVAFVAADVLLLVLIFIAAKLVRQEIAERERAADDRARMLELQQQLMAIVGHDLRSPLSAVMTAGAMLARASDLPPGRIRSAERILSSARRMERIIRDLLEYTRLRVGGGIPVSPVATDLVPISRKVIEELELEHPGRKVEFKVEGDLRGEWDPDRLEQVISNLVSNALRHSTEGAVRVTMRGESAEISIMVQNDGPPIPDELLPHLFEAYSRGATDAGSRDGLGLGLFIVRNVVWAHGGTVDVRSKAAEGTTFRVRLPRRAPASEVVREKTA